MKQILILISSILISTSLMAAGGDGGGSGNENSKASLYDDAVKLVKRAGKLEKKDKTEKAKKTLFSSIQKIGESL